MPELPEVEITRRRIGPIWIGRHMSRVILGRPGRFFMTPPHQLRKALEGQVMVDLQRLGKYLIGQLDNGSRLMLHLGMTGQLFSSAAANPHLFSAKTRQGVAPGQELQFTPDVHTHVQIEFLEGLPKVYFRDVRRFGRIECMPPGRTSQRLEALGPDALGATSGVLWESAQRRRIPIKSLLLDQTVLAGVGNIYADEALFQAGIRPTRPAREVSRAECRVLARAIREVLRRALDLGGSTISDFVHPDGGEGQFQFERRVYARENQPCFACGTQIERAIIAQRSSHFCPRCQG